MKKYKLKKFPFIKDATKISNPTEISAWFQTTLLFYSLIIINNLNLVIMKLKLNFGVLVEIGLFILIFISIDSIAFIFK